MPQENRFTQLACKQTLTNFLYSSNEKNQHWKVKKMNQQNQVQNPPMAAYWLSMIGAIIGLLAGILLLGIGAFLGIFTFGFGFLFTGVLGIWMILASIIVIIFAGKLKSNPMEHIKWGALILVFSLLGVGGILGLIGGILAIVYTPRALPPQPTNAQPQQAPSQQQATRVCPQCGRIVQADERFCPNCGKQLY
jgi:hypothetical protein